MKKAIIILILVIAVGGWTANKFLVRANQGSEAKERFLEYASDYNYDAQIFLTEQAKLHHDEAFAASYRMWKLTPISELDLSSHYDQEAYYRTLNKIITEAAKKEGQRDAYVALIDMGKHYGVEPSAKPTPTIPDPRPAPAATKESALGKPKLGDKRAIPKRHRDDD